MNKLRSLLFTLALLCASPSWAALTIDTSGGSGLFSSSDTQSVTLSGSDRAILVMVTMDNASRNVSSITYNGVSLVQVSRATGGSACSVEIWALSNPASGTHNLVVTLDGGNTGIWAWVGFNGAHQTTASLTGTPATSTTNSVTVTSASGDIVLDAMFWGDSTGPTLGAGQTAYVYGQPAAFSWGVGTYEAGASSVVMNYANTPSFDSAHIGVSVKPLAGGGGAPSTIFFRRRTN